MSSYQTKLFTTYSPFLLWNRRIFLSALLAQNYVAERQGLPPLTFTQMLQLEKEETDDGKASLVLRCGDFPEYMASLKIEEIDTILEQAMRQQREASVLVLLAQTKDLEGALLNSPLYRCLSSL